jgi:hypothetical protein
MLELRIEAGTGVCLLKRVLSNIVSLRGIRRKWMDTPVKPA